MTGCIRVGIGGWTFEPWRGTFYPLGLPQSAELHYASRALSTLEINGTYYSTFKRQTWRKWRDEAPAGFVFSVKASRYCTNRRDLAEAGPAIERFLAQGLGELGDKLGPINWQLALTKAFDEREMASFLGLLLRQVDGVALRHAIEVRHASFASPAFTALARDHGVAIVCAQSTEFPELDEPTADFSYTRLMCTREDAAFGIDAAEVEAIAKRCRAWARRGDVFAYFIDSAKAKNPAAAMRLATYLEGRKTAGARGIGSPRHSQRKD